MNAAILKRPYHLETGAIADMTKPLESMPAKSSLKNFSVAGSIEHGSPLFQLANSIWGLLRMNVGHPPVIQKLSAAHRVAKMRAPIVRFVHIGNRCGDAAFSHDSVRLTEERFTDDTNLYSLTKRLDRRAQTSPTCPDNKHIVFVCFVLLHGGMCHIRHSNLRSRIAPVATNL